MTGKREGEMDSRSLPEWSSLSSVERGVLEELQNEGLSSLGGLAGSLGLSVHECFPIIDGLHQQGIVERETQISFDDMFFSLSDSATRWIEEANS